MKQHTLTTIFMLHFVLIGGISVAQEITESSETAWVDLFNNRRLLEPIGNIPPVELEQMYYQDKQGKAMVA